MGKSKRFHKRVQKRHTRKHKQTRKKNKMNKNYSRKQRGGNAVVGLTIGAGVAAMVAIGAITAALSERRGAIIHKQNAVFQEDQKNTAYKRRDEIVQLTNGKIASLMDRVGENEEYINSLIVEAGKNAEKVEIARDLLHRLREHHIRENDEGSDTTDDEEEDERIASPTAASPRAASPRASPRAVSSRAVSSRAASSRASPGAASPKSESRRTLPRGMRMRSGTVRDHFFT